MLRQHRALRWLAPVGVLGAVGVVAGGMLTASANPEPLPPTTPAALLAGLQGSQIQGFSGTVIAQLSLGLPSLPGITTSGSDTSMTALLAGSHTLRCSSGVIRDQAATSDSSRPQPMQMFDRPSLHTPTQGDGGTALALGTVCDI